MTTVEAAVGEQLAAVVQLDERARHAGPLARADALALVGGVVAAVVDHQVEPDIGAAVLRAWRPAPAPDGGILVTRPHDWPR